MEREELLNTDSKRSIELIHVIQRGKLFLGLGKMLGNFYAL